ncbi:Sulfite exporter TauE/SafE [Legionella moravica]|uniref:Probable membrane transporter protein n=1 Tax=Legionella moravica TaxID=39962 RepID=A0A378JXK2_9GAMM|nr:sulfite exporter TauE/SafE family protein [Legionella moravica]KTD37377.1 Sulfite exporter TauE/SafE [Legionella moravica]STX63146.1 Sulfite exporter TauE/SafE [Legionella moravica]
MVDFRYEAEQSNELRCVLKLARRKNQMLILGYILALFMGLILGMIGAGGAILTVPILVYFLGVMPVVATAYSLLIVGSTALLGSITYWKKKQVYLAMAVIFSIPALLTVFFTRFYIVPSLPELIVNIPKNSFVMIIFAVLMLIAGGFMLKPISVSSISEPPVLKCIDYFKLMLCSICIGLLSGLVGAGGGFLIIPSLIAFFGLGMKDAIGTSLTIIAINSIAGFQGDRIAGTAFNWPLLTGFILLTLTGMMLGILIGSKLHDKKLRVVFGLFTLTVGVLIMIKEIGSLISY